MALYRKGKAAMNADGVVTGTGTEWMTALSLIRPGATIMFLSSPIQMAVVNKVVSDTEIRAVTTNGAVVESSDYVILLSDSLTVDGLAQDVAETLRYYQSQEAIIAEAIEFFKEFDFEALRTLAEQVKSDAASSAANAAEAAGARDAAKASEANAKSSEEAAEAARDQTQQIIESAGDQSTLVVLAQPDGYEKIGGLENFITAPTGGSVPDHLWNSTTIEAFLSQASGNVDDAIDLAIAYCVANNCKVIQLGSGKKYPIKRTHTVPNNIAFIGDRHGRLQQGSGYSSAGTTPAERAANPAESAFLWYGPTETTWFSCGSQVTFSGVVFGAPNQNWSATSKADIIDYGTSIVATSNLNTLSCIYYGMKNFVVATGGSHYYKNNSGFAMERDYQISNSRDINRIESCHANPNVIRPNQEMWRCLISNSRALVTLTNHDGTFVTDCHTFCFKKAVVNKSASNYLGTLFLDRLHLDQTGCVLDNDTAGDGVIFLGKVDCIGDNASDAGTTTPDSDSGYIILRKTTNTLITPIYLLGVHCQAASSLVTSKPPVLINYQTSSGYVIHPLGVHCPEPTDNGAGTSCQMTGSVSNGVRSYTSNPIRENLIPNPGWASRHPANSIPRGWFFTNCTVTQNAGRTVTGTGEGARFGVAFRQWAGSRTYIFTANSIGQSSGVNIVCDDGTGVETTYSGTWTKRGQKYYCVITATTVSVFHTITIDVGNSGNALSFEYAALVPGQAFTFDSAYTERQQKPSTLGASSYSVSLNAGGSHKMYDDQAGTAGAYTLHISSAIGAMICNLIKLNPTATPKITVVDSQYPGGNTFDVTWPDNSTPVITSSGAGVLYITLNGASYSTKY